MPGRLRALKMDKTSFSAKTFSGSEDATEGLAHRKNVICFFIFEEHIQQQV